MSCLLTYHFTYIYCSRFKVVMLWRLQALDKMTSEWTPINFEVMPYKSTGTFIIKVAEEVSQLLDDHIVMTQSMSFSPYKKPFEERISKWEAQLHTTQVDISHGGRAFQAVSQHYVDAAYCHRQSRVVCLSVCRFVRLSRP